MAASAVISQNFAYYITNDAADPVTFTTTRGLKIIGMKVFATAVSAGVILRDAAGGNTIATCTTVANTWVDAVITPANAVLAEGAIPQLDPIAATTTQIVIECISESGVAVTLSV